MDVKHISKTLSLVAVLPRLLGLLPIKYCTSRREFVVVNSKHYWCRYYCTLAVAYSLKIFTIYALIMDIFVANTFSFNKQSDVLRAFYYLPISMYAFINSSQTLWRIREIPATMNTFLQFYQIFQGVEFD